MSKTRIYLDYEIATQCSSTLPVDYPAPVPATHATESSVSACGYLQLATNICHRLQHVLRLKPGAELTLFDTTGREYLAQIIAYKKPHAWLQLLQQLQAEQAIERVTAGQVGLLQSIVRPERMDYALQKACELGVDFIQPLLSDHCHARAKPATLQKRQQHWQAVIIAAAEQCGRRRLPVLRPWQLLSSSLAELGSAPEQTSEPGPAPCRNIICHWQADPDNPTAPPPSLQHYLRSSGAHPEACAHSTAPASNWHLLIGPEGGFSQHEMQLARQHGWQTCSLGPRILRTETAASVALALWQAQCGDLR